MTKNMTKDKYRKRILQRKYSASRMVSVTDYWCPNFPDDKIKLSINIWMSERDKATVYMIASGNDDDYVALRSEPMSPVCAIGLYKHWKEYIFDKVPDGCNHEWFFEHGFDYD